MIKPTIRKTSFLMLTGIAGSVSGLLFSIFLCKKKYNQLEEKKKKMTEFYHVLTKWLSIRQNNKSLTEYFEKYNYKTIAIYGMKELGKRLYEELKETNINVRYAIDKNASQITADINVLTPDEPLDTVDVVVVTAIHYFDDIEMEMSEILECPIISIEDIIYELI